MSRPNFEAQVAANLADLTEPQKARAVKCMEVCYDLGLSFGKVAKPTGRTRETPKTERGERITLMLDAVLADLEEKDQQIDFIDSLARQFGERGDLTDKQISGLQKFYERCS